EHLSRLNNGAGASRQPPAGLDFDGERYDLGARGRLNNAEHEHAGRRHADGATDNDLAVLVRIAKPQRNQFST
ncbi:MAG TPA: hypothetical protein VF175_10005, partial [Lacipirellula sp.]